MPDIVDLQDVIFRDPVRRGSTLEFGCVPIDETGLLDAIMVKLVFSTERAAEVAETTLERLIGDWGYIKCSHRSVEIYGNEDNTPYKWDTVDHAAIDLPPEDDLRSQSPRRYMKRLREAVRE